MLLRRPGRALLTPFLQFATITLFAFTPPAAASSNSSAVVVLAPKLQKELGKALEALRTNKFTEARKHLDVVYRAAPSDAETNFLLGIYSLRLNDLEQARSFLEKVLSSSPNHFGALLALGGVFLEIGKVVEASQYLSRAVEAEPTSWRAHGALADAYLRRSLLEESIREAERSLELGHGQADAMLLLLIRAHHLRGDEQQAALAFETYLRNHSNEPSAAKLIASFPNGLSESDLSEALTALPSIPAIRTTTNLLSSNWMPPDIDEIVPPVVGGVSCNVDEILEQAERRVLEFVASVDQFTATERVIHESINRFGLALQPHKFEFDYLVSIKQNRIGLLSVDEYRNSHYRASDFPDGIATTGLAALMLIFHPYYAPDFKMTCEGLSRAKGQPAWQIHFQQRADKPSEIRTYQTGGPQGPVYAASLKGRVWIAANSFQIIRMETDLMAPLPQIRLVADHAAIEYGSVHFRNRGVDLWLPQTAEVFYDWRGKRTHRRHNFGNYLLYSVDDKQQITVPQPVAPNP
jgi:tetratricopeptide (TPR) repeat protein